MPVTFTAETEINFFGVYLQLEIISKKRITEILYGQQARQLPYVHQDWNIG